MRGVVAFLGAAALLYAMGVLGFVVTCPDLRLRALLIEPTPSPDHGGGISIRVAANCVFRGAGAEPIQDGDVLLQVGDQSMRSSLDLIRQLMVLRAAESHDLRPGDEPWRPQTFTYPWLTEETDGDRWVRIRFQRAGAGNPETGWVLVQSLPPVEIVLSFVWLVLQLGIFAVGAVAFWRRPLDRPSLLFFAMCTAALAAFMGGFHWWVIAGSVWLVVPFAVGAILLPPVLLHFFLIYPRQNAAIAASWRVALLYAVPVLALVLLLLQLGRISVLHSGEGDAAAVGPVHQALDWLRRGVFAYVAVGAVYFLAALAALRSSLGAARAPLERIQLQWIWRAALVATVCITYALFLAVFHREDFALGAARLPMFLASVSFLLAYTVGIIRYRLILTDDGTSRGALYYVVSSGLTVAFSLAIVLSALVPGWLNVSPTSHQAVAGGALLMLSAVLLVWVRDALQQRIDRRFFREKYRLDEALEQINRAAGRVGDPAALARMMLASCRDVLGTERSALYVRNATGEQFELLAAEGEDIPPALQPGAAVLTALERGGTRQRISLGDGRGHSPVQQTLHRLRAGLIHALEIDRQIAGLVFLGPKQNGGEFSAEDLAFLHAISQVTTAALTTARTVAHNLARMNDELQLRLEKITEQQRRISVLQAELTGANGVATPTAAKGGEREFRRGNLRGRSAAIEAVLETARKVASSESSVLIRGESGTGKELLAHVLHDNSPRREGPMIRVHCAALSPTLLESELFGHVKGAFTGAHRDKVGRFEAAHGGTLFLDEIGDISLETQIKLLRVLQERCFEPVGGSQTIHVDVRLITATHQNLEELITRGAFREDLYYRLNVISVTLPPLRERGEDIFELALHFLSRSARRIGKRVAQIDDAALDVLERYAWPGNIRQLENVIERAVVLAESDRITIDDLPADVVASRSGGPRHIIETKPLRHRRRAQADAVVPAQAPADEGDEREPLLAALRQCGGNKAQAARLLGLPRSTYFSKLRKFGIE